MCLVLAMPPLGQFRALHTSKMHTKALSHATNNNTDAHFTNALLAHPYKQLLLFGALWLVSQMVTRSYIHSFTVSHDTPQQLFQHAFTLIHDQGLKSEVLWTKAAHGHSKRRHSNAHARTHTAHTYICIHAQQSTNHLHNMLDFVCGRARPYWHTFARLVPC